jgi:hypothetical protein
MKHGMISFSPALIAALFALPLAAWAGVRPDFDDDAKPILRVQPHLIQEVESRYEVKDSGTAKYPGDDERRAMPPYIFEARPRGSNGPFNLRLLIQPGPPGRILRIVDMTKVHPTAPPGPSAPQPPAVANNPSTPPPAPAPATQAPAPPAPAPARPPSEPTADTPSGPIMDSGSQAPPSSTQPSLEPPPDPAPATH